MAKLFPARRARRTPRIEIIPMVDVMFLLLVFYILSSLALHNQRGIPINLPAAQSGDPAPNPQEIIVTIRPTGEFYLNKERVEADKLGDALGAWAAAFPGGIDAARKLNVILNADLSAQHRHVVLAMDQLRKLGFNNFVISTEPSPSP